LSLSLKGGAAWNGTVLYAHSSWLLLPSRKGLTFSPCTPITPTFWLILSPAWLSGLQGRSTYICEFGCGSADAKRERERERENDGRLRVVTNVCQFLLHLVGTLFH
jgi:hypothetical protein